LERKQQHRLESWVVNFELTPHHVGLSLTMIIMGGGGINDVDCKNSFLQLQ